MNTGTYQWNPKPALKFCVQDAQLPEEEYQHFWRSLRFPRRFRTLQGESILVMDGGIPNQNAGPDFVNAVLVVGGKIRKGAVEVHREASGWIQHGHHKDPRYGNVILQVLGHAESDRVDYADVPIRPAFTILSPPIPAATSGSTSVRRCSREPLPSHSRTRLAELGTRRLQAKARRFRRLLDVFSPEHLWYRSALRGLGYGANVTNMERIATRLPLDLAREVARHLTPQYLFQFLMGLTGYGAFYDLDTSIWEKLSARYRLTGFRYHDWRPLSARPVNHPLFRLYLFMGVLDTWWEGYSQGWQEQTPQVLLKRLRVHKSIPRPYTSVFGMQRIAIGTSRIVEILVNCYIPLWMATAAKDTTLDLQHWAEQLPYLPVYRWQERFIGSTHWQEQFPRRTLAPMVSQGFLHLHHQWCEAGRCRQCPVMSQSNAFST